MLNSINNAQNITQNNINKNTQNAEQDSRLFSNLNPRNDYSTQKYESSKKYLLEQLNKIVNDNTLNEKSESIISDLKHYINMEQEAYNSLNIAVENLTDNINNNTIETLGETITKYKVGLYWTTRIFENFFEDSRDYIPEDKIDKIKEAFANISSYCDSLSGLAFHDGKSTITLKNGTNINIESNGENIQKIEIQNLINFINISVRLKDEFHEDMFEIIDISIRETEFNKYTPDALMEIIEYKATQKAEDLFKKRQKDDIMAEILRFSQENKEQN